MPSDKWLLRNGYFDMLKCKKKHPDLFAHIEQEKDYKAYNKCLKCGSEEVEACSDEFLTEEEEETYYLFFECKDCGAIATEKYVYVSTQLE